MAAQSSFLAFARVAASFGSVLRTTAVMRLFWIATRGDAWNSSLANGSEFHACARASLLVLPLVRSVLLCGLALGALAFEQRPPRIRAIEMVWTYFRCALHSGVKSNNAPNIAKSNRYL